jgi:putative ABC transport system substrate-binding protein
VFYVEKAEDVARAFDAAVKQRADAVLVGLGPVIQNNVGRVVELAARHRLPSVFSSREFVVAGGLMAYGVSYPDSYRRAASYVDKSFKGANAGDLPIEQPTKFELVINLKTAKALGLTIPRRCCCGRIRSSSSVVENRHHTARASVAGAQMAENRRHCKRGNAC